MKKVIFAAWKKTIVSGKFMLLWIFISNGINLGKSHEAVLLDTRTATSDLGWAKSPDSKWEDLSSSHPDGNERRNLMVCQIKIPKQNNWIRSPFIPVDGAKRVYVEFEFTIRTCDDVEYVATCKETFNLYYYETDSDEATSTFPPWNEEGYRKVDTVAADRRFRPGSNATNYETRDIGPLKKKGIYIAIQDTGACIAIMHVRVYYKYCVPTDKNLANFRRTNAGPERTSLIETSGACVKNAINENNENAVLHCNSEGEWTVPKGRCICNAGYSPSTDRRICQSCGRGLYKPRIGNQPCQRCPAYSHSIRKGARICDCMIGYFREISDPSTSLCSKPPSKPTNLRVTRNQTRAILTWGIPINNGGRNDVTYRIECLQCQRGFSMCSQCSSGLSYLPSQSGIDVTKVTVLNINFLSFYKFIVYAENGVSDVSGGNSLDVSYAIATLVTPYTKPPLTTGLSVAGIGPTTCHVTWNGPTEGGDKYLEYEVRVNGLRSSKEVETTTWKNSSAKIKGLLPNQDYTIEVRAVRGKEYGPYSAALTVHTRPLDAKLDPDNKQNPSRSPLQVVVGAIVGIMCVIAMIIVASFIKRRRRKYSSKTKIAFEKHPMFNTNTLLSSGIFFGGQKTYVDPTTYENPQSALLDFTKELEASCISIETTIGGGEFGDVCRGHIRLAINHTKQEVAIKTLKCGSTPDEKLNFLSEASIMGQFDHPNVIRLEGVVTKSLPLMIITEFMDNGSLDNFLRNNDGEFSVLQLVGMLRHIAAGMKYLSDMGYVHRDLAARNVLVNEQMVCKVSDFGLSRVLEESDDATYTTRGGKIPIRWTSPEAITYRKFTSASDVWSFGIVIWEVMSYGERPYWGMSNHDVIAAVDTGYRLPAPMDCPLIQHQLMLECWKKNRSDRPKFISILSSLDRMLRDPIQLNDTSSIRNYKSDHLSDGESSTGLFSHSNKQHLSAYHTVDKQSEHALLCGVDRGAHAHLSSLGAWLESIGLEEYKENFIRRGYCLMEQMIHFNSSDLDEFGITDIQHQKIFLENIDLLKIDAMKFKQSLHPPEDNLNGIPV